MGPTPPRPPTLSRRIRSKFRRASRGSLSAGSIPPSALAVELGEESTSPSSAGQKSPDSDLGMPPPSPTQGDGPACSGRGFPPSAAGTEEATPQDRWVGGRPSSSCFFCVFSCCVFLGSRFLFLVLILRDTLICGVAAFATVARRCMFCSASACFVLFLGLYCVRCFKALPINLLARLVLIIRTAVVSLISAIVSGLRPRM